MNIWIVPDPPFIACNILVSHTLHEKLSQHWEMRTCEAGHKSVSGIQIMFLSDDLTQT